MEGDKFSRYSRQTLFKGIGKKGQEVLSKSCVVIIGCGALGSVLSNICARAGIGKIRIVDRDVLELNNLQRQILFDEDDVKDVLPKAIAAQKKLKKINSSIVIESRVLDATSRNIEEIISGADLVLDGTDNFEIRYLINDACIKHKTTWIYGGVIGSIGMSMNIIPQKGPCLRCVFPNPPGVGTLPSCETEGVINTIPSIVASVQATEAFKILLGAKEISKRLLYIDVWKGVFNYIEVEKDSGCITCEKEKFDFLEARETLWVSKLCGRNAVQISPLKEQRLSLVQLKNSLEKVATVFYNGLLLQARIENFEFIIFPSGRVIVKGTEDEALARTIYAKYIGM
jgi:adenylyltransferase/sulfurtransferase